VIQMALHQGDSEHERTGGGDYPERLFSRNGHRPMEEIGSGLKTTALVAGAALAAGGLAFWAMKKTRNP
jgi:hypothetical protein